MKRSLFLRTLNKLQTTISSKLMEVFDAEDLGEDVHLRHYAPLQAAAEARLPASAEKTQVLAQKRVLIVIPFRDKWEMTERCLNGLLSQTIEGLELLVALVDNGSVEQETSDGIAHINAWFADRGIKLRHLRYEVPFNFSYLNNQAVRDCEDFRADVLGLLNNDIEFLENDSLTKLVEGTDLPDAGAVGCTLIYPTGKIQHLFVFVGSKIVGSHPYKGRTLNLESHWYDQPRAVGAVTGAVTFMKLELFTQAEGFDEDLPTSYQDVDLCLKLQKLGKVNWVLPRVLLVHHETQTRSREPSWKEAERVEKRWGAYLLNNPYVSPLWSRKSEHFVLTPKGLLKAVFSLNGRQSKAVQGHPLAK